MNAHDTPRGTRMMWHASVNAIWTRAHGTGLTAKDAWIAGTMDISASTRRVRFRDHRPNAGEEPDDTAGYSWSRRTSLPCAVSAQTTATATAMIATPQTGYHGSHANAATPLTIAMITPTVRAHTAPVNTPNPASTMMIPTIRWIHPHVERSNWKM